MKILHVPKRQFKQAEISLVKSRDLSGTFRKRFNFDWSKEANYDIYKITLVGQEAILGLISLHVIEPELRIEIRLLESAKENIGKKKMYDRVAGCLIAFACKLSFSQGFDGFISLNPKTVLVAHYIRKYRMYPMGKHLVINIDNARALIEEYLEND